MKTLCIEPTGNLLVDGAQAAEAILAHVWHLHVHKALDPMNERDFLVISKRLADALKGETRATEASALKQAIGSLDVDWRKLSDGERERVVLAARSALKQIPDKVMPKVEERFRAEGEKTIKGAKQSVSRELGLDVAIDFNAKDQRIADKSAKSQGNYIRNEYGKREEAFSQKARDIVKEGLDAGHGRYEIGERLKAELGAQGVKRSDAYWTMAAGVFVARSRAWGAMSSYQECGLTRYTIMAVLDEVTTLQCRLMHGKTFSVARALESFEEADAAGDPEDVRYIQPWLKAGKDDNGEFLYTQGRDGAKTQVARVEQSAVGQKDEQGAFKQLKSDDDLAKAGVLVPPFHANCRTTVVPDMTSVQPMRGAKPRAAKPAAPPKPPAVLPPPPQPEVAPAPSPMPPPQVGAPVPGHVDLTEEEAKRPPRISAFSPSIALKDAKKAAAREDGRIGLAGLGVEVDGTFIPPPLHGETRVADRASDIPWSQVRSLYASVSEAKLKEGINRWFESAKKGVIEQEWRVPVAYKYQGQYYAHDNEALAAMKALGASAFRARIIDLDKPGALAPGTVLRESSTNLKPGDYKLGREAVKQLASLPTEADVAKLKPEKRGAALGLKMTPTKDVQDFIMANARANDARIAAAREQPQASLGIGKLIASPSSNDLPSVPTVANLIRSVAEGGKLPEVVVSERGGKFYIVRGAEAVAAAKAMGITSLKVVNISDTHTADDFAKFAQRSSPEKGDKPRTASEQEALRQALRTACAMAGMTNADLPSIRTFKAKGADKVLIVDSLGSSAVAQHGWEGTVSVIKSYMRGAAALLAKMTTAAAAKPMDWRAIGINARSGQMDGLVSLLHEQCHGASPIIGYAYQGAGVGIEEGPTEMLAHRVGRVLFGVQDPKNAPYRLEQPKWSEKYKDWVVTGSYQTFQKAMLDHAYVALRAADPKTKREDVPERFERAIIAIRGRTPPQMISSAEGHARAILEELGVPKKEIPGLVVSMTSDKRLMKKP